MAETANLADLTTIENRSICVVPEELKTFLKIICTSRMMPWASFTTVECVSPSLVTAKQVNFIHPHVDQIHILKVTGHVN